MASWVKCPNCKGHTSLESARYYRQVRVLHRLRLSPKYCISCNARGIIREKKMS